MNHRILLLLMLADLLAADDSSSGWKEVYFWVDHTYPSYLNQYSQAGQDELVIELLGNKTRGYFVDLAANNATYLSNTIFLENQYNWGGLCIEVNSIYHWELARRKCIVIAAAVYSKSHESVTFNLDEYDLGAFGGIVGDNLDNKVIKEHASTFKTISLLQLLRDFKAPKVIDYFSFDVEGAETDILKTFPLHEYTFLVWSVERPTLEIHRKLTKHGYWFLKLMSTWGECMYVHKSIPGFKQIMDTISMDFRRGRTEIVFNCKHNISASFLLEPKWGNHDERG